MSNYYCENCNAEKLKNYIQDEIGGIFCDNKCLSEFAYEYEHKEIKE